MCVGGGGIKGKNEMTDIHRRVEVGVIPTN